jgi:GNAT superfamily N-acetyltransferase
MSELAAPPVARIERVWADDNVAFATSLQALDVSWQGETFPLAGGHVVLCGDGLFVNIALVCGVTVDLEPSDLERLELRCATVGVPPAIELTAASTTVTRRVLIDRGYRLTAETSALTRAINVDAVPDENFSIRTVGSAHGLRLWQETAAKGWGHDTDGRRRARDAFAAAAFATEGQTLFLGLDRTGAVVGCASVQLRDGIATLGGMSTLPDHRRRGVQTALVHHRLRFARASGATWAVSTTEPGSASERNLVRLGFLRSHVKETFEPQR